MLDVARRLGVIWVLLMAGAGGAALAQPGPTRVLPQWSSDQIRAARPLGQQEALVLEIRRSVQIGDAPETVTTETVILAPDFTEVKTAAGEQLDDHLLCRTLAWTAGGPLRDDSCFAGPAFRLAELDNRHGLHAILSKVAPQLQQAPLQPYWGETELGVQTAPVDRLAPRAAAAGEGVEYVLAGKVVAQTIGWTGADLALRPEEMQRFGRFLALHLRMHPQMRNDLAKAARLPARIEVGTLEGDKERVDTLVITGVRREAAAYPLPPGLFAGLGQIAADDAAAARGLREAVLASEGRSSLVAPTPRELLDQMRAAGAGGRPIGALLGFMGLTQLKGGTLLTAPDAGAVKAEAGELLRAVKDDPEVAGFLQANTLAGDPNAAGDRQEAARFLAGLNTEGLPFGTFRYVTYANLLAASRDAAKWDPAIAKAMPSPIDCYWLHIAASPWSSFAYKDLGMAYLGGYDTPAAWVVFDLGRGADKDWRSGPMFEVGEYEDRLRREHPEFF